EFLKDKILVAGATAIGIYDLRVTPFEENYPGAETHANVIDNLVRSDFLSLHPEEAPFMLATLALLGLALSFALTFVGALAGLLTTSGLVAAILLLDRYYFFENGILI